MDETMRGQKFMPAKDYKKPQKLAEENCFRPAEDYNMPRVLARENYFRPADSYWQNGGRQESMKGFRMRYAGNR